jgi:hypothetical protein
MRTSSCETSWTRNFWPMRSSARAFALNAQIACFAALAPLLTRMRIDRLARMLEPARLPAPPSISGARDLAAQVDQVLRAGRPLIRSGCLVQGITRYYFLRRAGVQVVLCFGIGTQAGSFVGHCWLDLNGEPFLEQTDPRLYFTEMYRFPRPM